MRRRRRGFVIAGAVGVTVLIWGGAPVIQSASGAVPCPVGISFDTADPASQVQPPTVVYGVPIALYGQLVPETGADVSSETISIHRIDRGTSTPISIGTATTDARGNFSTLYTPTYSALYQADWAGTTDCAAKTSAENAFVTVRMGIASTKPFVQGMNGSGLPGTWWTIYGGVRPNKAGKTVNLTFRMLGSSTWTTLPLTLDSHSNFRKTFSSARQGATFEFRAVYRAQDALNVGSVTPFIFVRTLVI